jgi:hypothetical protein
MYCGMSVPPLGGGLPPYATDFREFANGVEISTNGWTKRTGAGGSEPGSSSALSSHLEATVQTNATSLSGRRVQIDHDQAFNHVYGITYDAIPDTTTDCEVLALMQWTVDPTSFGGGAVMLRASSTAQDSYNACPSYGAAGPTPPGEIFELNEVVAGYHRGSGGTDAGDEVTQSISASTRYWVRLKATGTAIKAKMWAYGGAEPSSWSVSFTDSTRSTGLVGLMVVNPSEPYYCEWFSVGLGSKTAPFPNG